MCVVTGDRRHVDRPSGGAVCGESGAGSDCGGEQCVHQCPRLAAYDWC